MKQGENNGIANYEYFCRIFGNLEKVIQSDHNPETLVKKLLQKGIAIPKIYMACGTEDFLIETNRRFYNFLTAQNVPVKYIESPGGHDMPFWNEYFAKSFEWFAAET
jgi:S-formylglutathione hydrolase FrmB